MDNYGSLYFAHYEVANIGTSTQSPAICQDIKDYNVVNTPSTAPNSGLGPFFGFGTSAPTGVEEYGEVKNNLFTGSLVGGRQVGLRTVPGPDHYEWQTDGCGGVVTALCPSGSPINHIIITGYGSSCRGSCNPPVAGQGEGPGGAPVGLQPPAPSSVFGGPWPGGCVSSGTTLCTRGETAAMNPGIVFPNTQNTVTVNGTFSPGISVPVGQCPSFGNYNHAIAIETSQNNGYLGIVNNCARGVLTLANSYSGTINNGDTITLSASVQNARWNNNTQSVAAVAYGHESSTLATWTAGTVTTSPSPPYQTTIAIGAGDSCPVNNLLRTIPGNNAANVQVYDGTHYVGVIQTCNTGASIVLYGLEQFAVQPGDTLNITSFAYGTLVLKDNFIDPIGSPGGKEFWIVSPSLIQGGGFQAGPGGGGAGGCAFPVSLSGNVDLTGGAYGAGNPNALYIHGGGC
jgi:hypothetical protein